MQEVAQQSKTLLLNKQGSILQKVRLTVCLGSVRPVHVHFTDRLRPQETCTSSRYRWRRQLVLDLSSFSLAHPTNFFSTSLRQYSVQIEDGGPNPRAFKVRLTEAAEINFHELGLFLKQQIGMSANVLMCINALNVALTHEATLRWPSRVNFVFPPAARPQDRMQLSGGYTATRGLWFSIRPSLSGLIINVDTSAGVFYNQGTLHDAAAAFLGCRVQDIPKAPDRLRIKLKNWLTGVKVGAPIQGDPKRTYGEFKIKVGLVIRT